MRTSAPIRLIVHRPTSLDGKIALAKQVAEVHSSTVVQHIKRMPISGAQMQEVLDAVVQTAQER